MAKATEARRQQLAQAAEAVACLASNRAIVPIHVSKVSTDFEIRKVLETIIRRWTEFERPLYSTKNALTQIGPKAHKEHVVPCRVLVDRMIMNPAQCDELLRTCVVLATVTKNEHRQLGGIFTHHASLYERMLACPVSALPHLGMERYLESGIILEDMYQ